METFCDIKKINSNVNGNKRTIHLKKTNGRKQIIMSNNKENKNQTDRKNRNQYFQRRDDFLDSSWLYYQNLIPNGSEIETVMKRVFEVLGHFIQYLNQSIIASKNREAIVEWEEINQEEIRVFPKKKLIEAELKTEKWFKIEGNAKINNGSIKLYFANKSENIEFRNNNLKSEQNNIYIKWDKTIEAKYDFIPSENEPIMCGPETIKLISVNKNYDNFNTINGKKKYKVINKSRQNDKFFIELDNLPESKETLYIDDCELIWNFRHYDWNSITEIKDNNGNVIKVENPREIKNSNGYIFEVTSKSDKIDIKDKKYNWNINGIDVVIDFTDGVWVHLIESKDAQTGLEREKIDYFFDDDVKAVWEIDENGKNGGERLNIISKNEKEHNIKLKRLPEKNKRLKTHIDTYQLKQQLNAMNWLRDTPLENHRPLIKLTERKDRTQWDKINPVRVKEDEWKILTDTNRNGTMNQRNFVEKALGTEDFAFLQGPPGSGKTTAICELLLQLLKKGKKVLLCSSTHVAIDNVLERIVKYDDEKVVFPIRIGDVDRVDDNVKEYQLEMKSEELFPKASNLSKDNESFNKYLLSISNLVCGTVIGILRHPQIRECADRKWAIQPLFDYLIIDESSKCTFQEFLVPSMFAERWIIIGDTKQLSPFADSKNIEANIGSITNENGVNLIPDEMQEASLIAHTIMEKKFNKVEKRNIKVPITAIYPADMLLYIKKEINIRVENKENIFMAFIGNLPKSTVEENIIYISHNDFENNSNRLIALQSADIIFVEEKLYPQVKNRIPASFLITGKVSEEEKDKIYDEKFIYKCSNFLKDEQKRFFDDKDFNERTWASEIAWRMARDFELRNNKDNYYPEQIEDLIPKTLTEEEKQKFNRSYATIKNIALPSILECLQEGVTKTNEKEHDSILTTGMEKNDFGPRSEILDYQNRMHPDISSFPRSEFYNESALKDSNFIIRDWNYNEYRSHCVWLDVEGRTDRGKNIQEKDKLIEELKKFCNWAKNNQHPEQENGNKKDWTVACITFYQGQERELSRALQDYTNNHKASVNFRKDNVKIKVCTVDRFQGQEADIVFLSMVNTHKVGFMDNPNRLNVALTRAKYQLVIIGDNKYFSEKQHKSDILKRLANRFKGGNK